MPILLFVCLCWLQAFSLVAPAQAASARVAAAADLHYALRDIAAAFEKRTGHRLQISYGSSGQFTAQIQQGAPFELFFSADERYVNQLHRQGLTENSGQLYAIGRLALFAPTGSPLQPNQGLKGLQKALQAGQIQRFAIANPAHAPYGRAAQEALTSAGLWPLLQKRLVLGENASQAAQFAASGSTAGGLIPYSLALAPTFSRQGRFALIPLEAHAPLHQRMVLIKGAGPVARALYQEIQQPQARQILQRYGFGLPVLPHRAP
ncbi:MAG: molybdate ABC transporter substrate-binding protein [Candidatus Sericytochromatia bacterium]